MTLDEAKSNLKNFQVLDTAILQGRINASQVKNLLPKLESDFEGTKEFLNAINKDQAKASAEETDSYTKFLIKKTQLENFIKNNSK